MTREMPWKAFIAADLGSCARDSIEEAVDMLKQIQVFHDPLEVR